MPQRPLYQGNVLPTRSNEMMLVHAEPIINSEPWNSVAQDHIREQGDIRQSWQTKSDLSGRGRELSHPEMHQHQGETSKRPRNSGSRTPRKHLQRLSNLTLGLGTVLVSTLLGMTVEGEILQLSKACKHEQRHMEAGNRARRLASRLGRETS